MDAKMETTAKDARDTNGIANLINDGFNNVHYLNNTVLPFVIHL